MKTVYENEVIKISETGRNYDFVAIIENKTDKKVEIIFDKEEMQEYNFPINPNDWIGVLASGEYYPVYEEIKKGHYAIEKMEDIL